MNPRGTRVAIGVAITAVLVRLIPLQWLHPLNWDELEFYRATALIAEGRLPFRDFWEHHAPLSWFLFAPFTLLTASPGVDAVLALRWAQIPVWIATFWLLHLWMRHEGIERFARWSATALVLCSSLFMTPAIEYRVEALGCALVMGGLVLVQRERYFFAGAAFCLAGFANLRLGPILVVAVLVVLITRRLRAWTIVAGGFTTLVACLGGFAMTGSLLALYQNLWVENLAEKYASPIIGGFFHRLLVPFGIRILASDRLFELAAVDLGGALVLLLGFAGILVFWRKRGNLLLLTIVQVANILFIAFMKFIYNYHFAMVVVLMVPLIATVIERIPRRGAVVAMLILATCVNAFAALFRGKELDRAYQDRIMREVHARTRPGDAVWSGVPWALRRDAAYHFWFLPELARQLVRQRLAEPYQPRNPPAAIVADHNILVWLFTIQPELRPYFATHYIPVWRELWVPAMNGRLAPGAEVSWSVPKTGSYRVFVSEPLAAHPWFHAPMRAASYKGADASRLTMTLPRPGSGTQVSIWANSQSGPMTGEVLRLRQGERLTVFSNSTRELAVILLSSDDRVLFRQPPPGVTLEGETTRITHVPHPGAQLAP